MASWRGRTLWTCGIVVLLRLLQFNTEAANIAFWVWNREASLSSSETDQLRHLQVETLYWHIGELRGQNQDWSWASAPLVTPKSKFRIIPVVRLETNEHDAFSPVATSGLVAKIRELVANRKLNELQIDFDCPDRLLADYARALSQCHPLVSRLSVTALAGWKNNASFPSFEASADEIVPMFYDLFSDSRVNDQPRPRALIETSVIAKQLANWRSCSKPWRAGLPNFNRLTIYNRNGVSRGHVRNWGWDDLCFNLNLRRTDVAINGGALFRVATSGTLADTPLAGGEWVCARTPDRTSLAAAARTAYANGAESVVYFRLPDRSDASGWSLAQFNDLEKTAPQFVLRRRGETFELSNLSDADLAPRVIESADDAARGYALEIESPAPIWREAIAGDFWRVNSHVIISDTARPVAVPFATRLTFWFSQLRAHQSLRTGLVSLAPGAEIDSVRYRVLSVESETWRKIE